MSLITHRYGSSFIRPLASTSIIISCRAIILHTNRRFIQIKHLICERKIWWADLCLLRKPRRRLIKLSLFDPNYTYPRRKKKNAINIRRDHSTYSNQIKLRLKVTEWHFFDFFLQQANSTQ